MVHKYNKKAKLKTIMSASSLVWNQRQQNNTRSQNKKGTILLLRNNPINHECQHHKKQRNPQIILTKNYESGIKQNSWLRKNQNSQKGWVSDTQQSKQSYGSPPSSLYSTDPERKTNQPTNEPNHKDSENIISVFIKLINKR